MKSEHTLNENWGISVIPIGTIPGIELYVDQVTTFMEKHLSSYKRYNNEKILTKTMINNYAKAKLFPSPVKKKYSRNHIILLILIYHLKNVLTINDISKLLAPVNAMLEEDMDCPVLEELYNAFTDIQQATADNRPYTLTKDSHSPLVYNMLSVLSLALKSCYERRCAENIIDTEFQS